MRAVEIIEKKRDRQELTEQEITFFIHGYCRGDIPDYQMAAWAMAVLFTGMTPRETTDLTMAMVTSGEVLNLSDFVPIAVDKHSTGGVGDKTTFVVEPIVAACGLPVGKMSGRGLGFSGGTLDKIESIPGYRTDLTKEEFVSQLKKVGLVLTGQTGELAPADGKLYALRDVTGTVQSIPLIASSIMSKKIAAGAQAIVLDVKVGRGAFMQTLEEGKELGTLLVNIANLVGRRAIAVISDMNQPLGHAVGNALELTEAIQTLQGGGPADFREHCLIVAGHMLVLGGKALDLTAGRNLAEEAIKNGRGFLKFRELVIAQGGDISYVDDINRMPSASIVVDIRSPQSGYLSQIDARVIGETAVLLGAGRMKKGDAIDRLVGVIVQKKIGDWVNTDDVIFTVHANSNKLLEEARPSLLKSLKWQEQPVDPLQLFYGVISG